MLAALVDDQELVEKLLNAGAELSATRLPATESCVVGSQNQARPRP